MDYCIKCKNTHYTFEGKCYAMITGCEEHSVSGGKIACTKCTLPKYLLRDGDCKEKLIFCAT